MRHRRTETALLALAALALLPLRTDGGQAECCNATASAAWMRNEPVNGDEAFFKLPSGPANVMLLLDVSGSMLNWPKCGDDSWSNDPADSNRFCSAPSLATPTLSGELLQTVVGTCAPSAGKPELAWMEQVVPQREYADPGRVNVLLADRAPWGRGCVGNRCLFDPDAYYRYGDWSAGATTTSATRRAHDTDMAFAGRGCQLLDGSNNPVRDQAGRIVDLGDGCRSCMASRGFYFYRVAYKTGSGTTITTPSNNVQLQIRGTFLNGSPPKFVAARKVVKDIAWMDDAVPSKLDQVRLGLAILDSGAGGNQRAQMIVPLGPDKAHTFPPTQAKFKQARQAILSVINADTTRYVEPDGTLIVDGGALAGGFFNPASGATPLATALWNVGQYFSSVGFYQATFGAAYQLSAFSEKTAGRANVPWVTSNPSAACSICWACQNNSIVVITDGSPNSEIALPPPLPTYDPAAYNLPSNCGTGPAYCRSPSAGNAPSTMPRVASWLRNTDLRSDMVTGGTQAVTVHTVGFNVVGAGAVNILRATANMGGGIFQNAQSARDLADAVFNALNQVVQKENSFSAASANSLQTVQTASSEAFLTRFKPNQTSTWEGHLFQGALFDEFLNGCDPTKPPDQQPTVACGPKKVSANFNGDADPLTGNSLCSGVFLIDRDCDEIAEDPQTGDFVKRGQGSAPANFPWDAGQVLSDRTRDGYRSADEAAAHRREIFTWVGGARVDLTAANAEALKPWLNVDPAWCSALLTRIGIPGGTDPTAECARQIVHFVRGWDVLDGDADSCWGPGNPRNLATCPSGTKGEERDRANDGRAGGAVFYKLGDIFHSSPAVVVAPVDEVRCDTGYEKQCVATLHSPPALPNQTRIDTSYSGLNGERVDAYERYRLDHRTRRRVVLVGANDGMLHAFHAGDADTSRPPDPLGAYPYTQGNGEELWAFVPPDLLPKLRHLLDAHQYMVDGSVMVRDVWVDHNADGVKQRNEFHTVAVFSERSGGTQFTALDVTDPGAPVMLWTFPKPCSEDARFVGQSWSDFAPRPPPLGPVRIASARDPRGFEERWVVMLNGGYDPSLARGRAVFMVDAWSGATLWRFTDDDFKAQLGFGSGTSMFPVPGAVALVDVGDTTTSSLDMDGFFDTATWGDLGGSLFVARFQEPGVIGDSGRVGNWFAARAFEQQRRPDDLQGVVGRNEFFYMTANAFEPITRTLRTFLGSGNRERMMDQSATCGTDNLMGCCRAGCTSVTATTSEDFGSCDDTSTFSCSGGVYQRPATSSSSACGATASCAAAPGNAYAASTQIHWECPGTGVLSDAVGKASCDADGLCSTSSVGTVELRGTFRDPPRNRYYGIWSYGRDPRKMFRTADEAKDFDRNRFTDVAFAAACSGPSAGSCTLVDTTQATVTYAGATPSVGTTCGGGAARCSATGDDAGWYYEYGRTCPLKACAPAPPWNDEKTGSGGTVVLGCAAWGGFRPFGASTSTDPCSGSLGTPLTYGYVANYVSGVPSSSCGYAENGIVYRAQQRSTTAPPTASTVRVTFSPGGEISYTTLQIDAGAPPGSKLMGTRSEIGEPVYWLEVPRQLHACRHVAGSAACE